MYELADVIGSSMDPVTRPAIGLYRKSRSVDIALLD